MNAINDNNYFESTIYFRIPNERTCTHHNEPKVFMITVILSIALEIVA